MINAWSVYLIALCTCFVLLFIYSVFIKYCAALIAWLSYLLIFVFIVGLGVFTYMYADKNYSEGDSTKNLLEIGAYVLWGIAVLYVFLLFCCFKDVRKSIAIL